MTENHVVDAEPRKVFRRLYHHTNDETAEDALPCIENGQVASVTTVSSSSENWRTHPIEVFSAHLSINHMELKKASRTVRNFYIKQDAHIRDLERLNTLNSDVPEDGNLDTLRSTPNVRIRHVNNMLIRIIFFTNLALLACKLAASIMSGSLSIISSLLDSCVDLASGGITWFAARQMRIRRPYSYPQGRTRLEPIGVVILAVFMGSVSLQLIAESIQAIVAMAQNKQDGPVVSNFTIGIMFATIFIKLGLWIVCVKFGRGPSIHALSVDQRNDIFSNSASILFSGLASRLPPVLEDERFAELKYLDPIGAILIGIYISYSWYLIGAEQTRNLAGHAAEPKFIQKIAFVSLNHHASIEQLDTIRAFHFGFHFLVEVDIVLPRGMCLKDAHDIGEALQKKLERVEGVERAFVHLDYEYSHHPESEHKIV